MNKLNKIIETKLLTGNYGKLDMGKLAKETALEFAKHILSEAAENSTVEMIDSCDNHTPYWGACQNCGSYLVTQIPSESVSKKSITSVINKYL